MYLDDADERRMRMSRPRRLGDPQPQRPDAARRPPRARRPARARQSCPDDARGAFASLTEAGPREPAGRARHAPRRRARALPRALRRGRARARSAPPGSACSPAPPTGRARLRLSRRHLRDGRSPAPRTRRARYRVRKLDSGALRFHTASSSITRSSPGGIDMALVRWEPVRELTSLQSEMNRLFNTFFDSPTTPRGGNGGRRAAGCRRWTSSRPTTTSSCAPICPAWPRSDVDDRARGQRPHRLRRAQAPSTRTSARASTASSASFGPFRRSLTLPEGVDADAHRGDVRQGRARGPHPQARGAQAAPRRDPGRRRSAAIEGERVRAAGRLSADRDSEPRRRGRAAAPRHTHGRPCPP